MFKVKKWIFIILMLVFTFHITNSISMAMPDPLTIKQKIVYDNHIKINDIKSDYVKLGFIDITVMKPGRWNLKLDTVLNKLPNKVINTSDCILFVRKSGSDEWVDHNNWDYKGAGRKNIKIEFAIKLSQLQENLNQVNQSSNYELKLKGSYTLEVIFIVQNRIGGTEDDEEL